MAIELSYQKAMNKEYQKADIPECDLITFRESIVSLFENFDMSKDEEHNKNLLMRCFQQSLYPHNAFNTDSKTDFVIYADEYSKGSNPVVLVETKKMGSDEMITPSNINKKGLHQLIYYYMNQEQNNNIGIKHLVVTDFNHLYIFDKMNFLRLFATSKTFAKEIKTLRNDKYPTDLIYKNYIKPQVEKVEDKLEFIHIDLKKVYSLICKDKEGCIRNKYFISAYKILSPTFLLKQRFGYNHNKLNQAFYDELLFIMGLEEKKDKNNKNILKIVRKEKNDRQFYSLIEQAMFKIKEKESLSDEEEIFERALGLVIVWINRILFIKLLESQLKEYVGNDDLKILDNSIIKNYSDLNALFFHILAHKEEERHSKLDKFKNVPYLNSSLFEESDVEVSSRLTIDNLMLGPMRAYDKTKVRTPDGKILEEENTLEYILDFLNSYDFGSSSKNKDSENLINAAVLGLIFEKINGYKDGAYFTPSYITEYMCRETIRMAVVDKFNETENGHIYTNFDDLKRNLPRRTKEDIEWANHIVNSIRICDPSVGSGHFLVSALNELITIKSELRILHEHTEDMLPIDWDIKIINDELDIRNGYGMPYIYDPSNAKKSIIQKSLFEEKRILIENCLFGVDINPKSVDICKLRLWIELLKNAYYVNNNGRSTLVTLPNIDTNVKCGNSLLSYRNVSVGAPYSSEPYAIPLVEEYKKNVIDYKNNNNKKSKAKLSISISDIKERLRNSSKNNLFDEWEKPETYEESMYRQAFEWMIEFPEILDCNGNYQGFDVVIGNPPYISLQTIKEASKVYGKVLKDKYGHKKQKYITYEAKGDIYSLFFERAVNILKPNGLLCFITSNKWMNTDYGKTTQEFLINNINPIRLIDFSGLKLFDKATVETNILLCSLSENKGKTLAIKITKEHKDVLKELYPYIQSNSIECNFNSANGWRIEDELEIGLNKRLQEVGTPIRDVQDVIINRGVTTGNNDAFVITHEKREEILNKCLTEEERKKTNDLIRPLYQGRDLKLYNASSHNVWLITLFPSCNYDIEDFPALKQHLLSFAREDLRERGLEWVVEDYLAEYCMMKLKQDHKPIIINGVQIPDKFGNADKSRKKGSNKWYETQDNIAYWNEFSLPKILWKRIGNNLRTSYDESGIFGLDSTCIATGKYTSFLCCLFNSKLGHYLLSQGQHTGTGDLLVSVQAVEPLPIPIQRIDIEKFNVWVKQQSSEYSNELQTIIDNEIYRIYGLDSTNDKEYIEIIEEAFNKLKK